MADQRRPEPSATAVVAAGTTGGAALVPIVLWAINGFPSPATMVPSEALALASALAAYAAIMLHVAGIAAARIGNRFFPDLVAGMKPNGNGTPASPLPPTP